MTNTRTAAPRQKSIDPFPKESTSKEEPHASAPTRAWAAAAWLALSFACLLPRVADAQPPTPPPGKVWVLAWTEDFNGSSLDWSKWNHRSEGFRAERTHDGRRIRWRYEHDNVGLADGHLVLRNTREAGAGYDLVKAAAIDTKGKFEQTYGYFEASIRIAPTRDGIHTAFWLQNDNRGKRASNGGVDGASDGAEIDILESVYTSNHYAMAVHWDGRSSIGAHAGFAPIHDGRFHTYALTWTPDDYTFYADGQRKHRMTRGLSHSDGYVILSTGVSWSQGNARTGTFPNEAQVDWVRVYELADDPSHNFAPVGKPTISSRNGTLVASAAGIHDQDGLTGRAFEWQWYVSEGDDGGYVEITGATEPEYQPRQSDLSKKVIVHVAFTDDGGAEESVYSDPFAVTHAPVITSTGPFTVNEGETPVATLTATDADTPAEDLAWSIRGGVDADHFTLTAGSVLAFWAPKDFEELDDDGRDGSYEVAVRVGDGANTVSDTLTVTLADVDEEGGPELRSAVEDGNALLLMFDEILDGTSTPAAAAFAVDVNAAPRGVTEVRLERNVVRLTLTGEALAWGDSVSASYTVPSSNPLRDLAGNPADSATIETLLGPSLTARFEDVPDTHGGALVVLSLVFSEAPDVSWSAMRDRLLLMENGQLTRARRMDSGNQRWEITIEPTGGDLSIRLPATRDCESGDAVCTEDGRYLRNPVSVTIAEGAVPPLTAEFDAPPEHDGSEDLTVWLDFNGPVDLSEWMMANRAVSVSGGRIRAAEHEIGARQSWQLTVEPTSIEDVVLTVSPPASCDDSHALCAADGRKLSSGAEVRVKGPASIPLTAQWLGRIPKHDGSAVFQISAVFSSPVVTEGEAMYRHAVRVVNGEATNAFPHNDGSRTWAFWIKPLYNETVRVELLSAADCTAEGTICTEDGRPLSESINLDIEPSDPNAVDETAPELLRAEVTVSELVLLYDEGLDESSTPGAGAFAVTVAGQPRDLAASDPVEVDGRRVRLTLASAVGHGDTVTVSYSVPTSSPVQDRAGNAVAAVSDQAANNYTPQDPPPGDTTAPELEGAEAGTDSLMLTYSEALDESSTPAAAAFTVTVAGEARSLAATGPVVVSGSTVTLALDSAAAPGDTVAVSYTQPVADALQDTAGNRAASATIAAGVPADTVVTPPLTASFEDMPATHGGSRIRFGLTFSEEPGVSHLTLRDEAFEVTGGTVFGAQRKQAGSNRRWTISVDPDSAIGAVNITLPETTDCEAAGAICTADARPLSHSLSAAVKGEERGPELSVGDASATEDDTVAFAVTLSVASDQEVTVDYATSDGTAESGTDFTAASGTLTFAAGDSSRTVSVATADDSDDEEDETFALTLSNASGAGLRGATATGTIVDNDEAAALTATFEDMPESYDESTFSFGLTFSEEVEVGHETMRGAFDVTDGSVTGVHRRQTGSNRRWYITVEPNLMSDSVTVTLPETTDCGASGAICTGDDRPLSHSLSARIAPPPLLTATFEDMPATHDGSRIRFGLTFSEELEVSHLTLRDEAFEVTGGTVFGAQRKERGSDRRWTISVDPDSADSAVTITLPETTDCNASGAICMEDGRPLSHSLSDTVAVEGEEATVPSLAVADASATEGEAVTFTVSLSEASGQQVTIDYTTASGTAESGTDFTAASGTLTFAAGDSSSTVSVATADDSVDEEDETFTLTLSNASGATLGTATATGTIVDNDTEAPEPLTATFEDMPESHDGSRISFGLTFSEELSVSYQTLRDEAFEVTGGTVFAAQRKEAGSNRRWTISADPDSATATVTITLPETTDCSASGAICTADNRPLSHSLSATVEGEAASVPSLGVADASATEGAAVAFTVSLSEASGEQVTVDYATSDGTAASGTDFTAASGTLTFAAGELSKTVSVATTDDSDDEEDETFTLTLSNPANATLGTASATGTIVDNDATATPLTATFEGMPETHHNIAFEFALKFSEEFPISYRTLRDEAFNVTGGDVTSARRRLKGSNLIWFIRVDPASARDTVTIALLETTDCDATGAICTTDKRPLSHSLSDTVIDAASASSGDVASGTAREDVEAALAVASGITPDLAAAALFGEARLSEARLKAVDRLGNRNGRYDLGDMLAWIERCRQGVADCGGSSANPGPAGAAAVLTGAAGGQRGSRRPGGRRDTRRRRRTGRVRSTLAMLLAVTLAWSCGDGLVGPAAPEQDQDPGLITVSLVTPAASRDSGVLLELEGPGIGEVRAPGFDLFESRASGRHRVIVAGSLRAGRVLRLRVPDRSQLPHYRVRVMQVAGEDYELRDARGYRAATTH